MWKQVREVTAPNLRSVPQRLGSSAVTVLGIAGVVVVLVGVLSMAQGFQRTMMTLVAVVHDHQGDHRLVAKGAS